MLPLSCPSGLFPEGDALSQVLSQDKLVHICSRLMPCVAFQKILTSPRGRASHFGATSRAGGHCSLPPVPWCLSRLCLLCQRGLRRDLVCRFLLGKTEVEVGRRRKQGHSPVSVMRGALVRCPYPELSALPFLERLTSCYRQSRGALRLLKKASSLVLPQEQPTTCCSPWGHRCEKPALLLSRDPCPLSVRQRLWPGLALRAG